MTEEAIQELLRELVRQGEGNPFSNGQAALDQLKTATPEEQKLVALRTVEYLASSGWIWGGPLPDTASRLLRRKLPWTQDEVLALVRAGSRSRAKVPYLGILNQVQAVGVNAQIAEELRRLRGMIDPYWLGAGEARSIFERIDTLLNGARPVLIEPVGAWTRNVFEEMAADANAAGWQALFQHTLALKSNEPSGKWNKRAAEIVEELGKESFQAAAEKWLAMGPDPERSGRQVDSKEADYQRGFVWHLPQAANERFPALLADFAAACLKKIPQLGAVSTKAGNAALLALAALPGTQPLAQLSRLSQSIRYDTAQRLIDEALQKAAERSGAGRDAMEDTLVQDHGFERVSSSRTEVIGGCVATLTCHPGNHVSMEWRDSGGKLLKSVPAAVKENYKADVQALQKTAKEAGQTLGAQRKRLEALLLTGRALPLDHWRKCFLDHPLMAFFSTRLIWTFETTGGGQAQAIPIGERLVDFAGNTVEPAPGSAVRLWHPLDSDPGTILSWRCRLEDHGIVQPFKQAHREVYLLTDAERGTGDYSRRFYGHLLRQHAFRALCEQRGWEFRLMGPFDSHNNPSKDLPHAGLRAEFTVDFPDVEDVSGAGIHLFIRTEHVTFLNADGQRVPLEQAPRAAFSEVLRDVDLFVGVCSVGNDPEFGTRQLTGPLMTYWQDYNSSALTASAESRRLQLARLLPSLAPLRERAELDDRHLIVRGRRASYKIHLGSGNVIAEPGSRYICIVPGKIPHKSQMNVTAKPMLPFEGDDLFAVILSKALLLASDDKITDPSILSQLP